MKISKDNINNCKILDYEDLTKFFYISPYISGAVQMCLFDENLSILKEIFPSYMIRYRKSEKDPYIFILANKKDYNSNVINDIRDKLQDYNITISFLLYDILENTYKNINELIYCSTNFYLPGSLKYNTVVSNFIF